MKLFKKLQTAMIATILLASLPALCAGPDLSESILAASKKSGAPVAHDSAKAETQTEKESVRDILLPLATGVTSSLIYRSLLRRAMKEFNGSLFAKRELFSQWLIENAINAAAVVGTFLIIKSIIYPLKKKIFDNECPTALDPKKNENMEHVDALVTCACYIL